MNRVEDITEDGVYLVMNPMTANAERGVMFGPWVSKEAAKAFVKGECAPEHWMDGSFSKTFKEGSVLEWMNPFYDTEWDEPGIWGTWCL